MFAAFFACAPAQAREARCARHRQFRL